MFKSLTAAALVAASLTSGVAFAAGHVPPAIHVMDSSDGKILTDVKGMTLYTFDKDTDGVSNCNDECAVKWPPLLAGADAKAKKEYTIITRADGSKQWAFEGYALYTWFKDKKPGDMTGDGVKGVWHTAKP